MNDSLLVYCYPTYSRALHLDSKGTSVVLAPDEMLLCLARSHRVDVVNLSPFASTIPLMRSKIVMKAPSEVNPLNYGYCWHMFRDPLAPEVRDLKPMLADCFPHTNILNPVTGLQNHFKHKYLPLLHAYGVGPAVIPADKVPADVQWHPTEWSVAVSVCKRFIKVYDFNNGRGDYKEWEDKRDTIVEFLDAAEHGTRSFFRIGYACGKLTPGWLYTQPDTALVQKTGTCLSKELHSVPERFHPRIVGAMQAMDINAAHLEGCYIKGEVKIFDVNAYPTSYGGTLAPISEAMARLISAAMRRGDPVH